MRGSVVLMLLLLTVNGASGEVLCPRVTTEHNADLSDLRRLRRYHGWENLEQGDLAVAVWRYLCDTETGLFHMATVNDGPDPWDEYSTVRDPVKLMNVFGVGYCGIFGPTLDGVFQGIGFEQGRAFGVSGWNHCTTEVWYGGGWHYFDLDVRGALLKPDGSVASVAEAQRDRDLWVNPPRVIEPFFPEDPDKARVFEIYRDSHIDYYYRWFQSGHVMDFRLRQGETLTRWWRPQGGRWHHLAAYNTAFMQKLLQQEPAGYKSNHADFSVWTQGNGLWHYQPDLTDKSSDFQDGVQSAVNIQPGRDGLELATAGDGEVIFEVFTPWIIVPKVNRLADPSDDTEASVVTLDAPRPLTVLVSLDHGMTWQETARVETGHTAVDLTPWVKGTYGFLLRLRANGREDELVLRKMEIRTWVQVAPISLPRLKAGRNQCRFELGDRYGGLTMPMFVLPNVADREDLKKYVVQMPEDYDLQRKTSRIRGDVVLRLAAPEGTAIDWFTAGACFSTFQGQAAENTDNRIAFSVGRPEGFQEVYKAAVPTWVNHWRYQWDQDVRLPQPAKRVFVKYTGSPGVNVLRATVHLKPERTPSRVLEITHGYKLGDRLIEKVVPMRAAGEYIVEVDGDPENVFIRLAVPSASK